MVLVAAAPWIMDIFLSPDYDKPELAAQRDSIIAFARYCLPQVFFYGMFALVGQVLNARRRFGPMMWAPIANNLVSIAILVGYLVDYGPVADDALCTAYTPAQEAWLGLGSTLGIAVQLLVLVPFLRAAGFHYRPRFDFKGTGLGHTLRLGLWTVLFVVVNQVAYAVVVQPGLGRYRPVARHLRQRCRRGRRDRLHGVRADRPHLRQRHLHPRRRHRHAPHPVHRLDQRRQPRCTLPLLTATTTSPLGLEDLRHKHPSSGRFRLIVTIGEGTSVTSPARSAAAASPRSASRSTTT